MPTLCIYVWLKKISHQVFAAKRIYTDIYLNERVDASSQRTGVDLRVERLDLALAEPSVNAIVATTVARLVILQCFCCFL